MEGEGFVLESLRLVMGNKRPGENQAAGRAMERRKGVFGQALGAWRGEIRCMF